MLLKQVKKCFLSTQLDVEVGVGSMTVQWEQSVVETERIAEENV